MKGSRKIGIMIAMILFTALFMNAIAVSAEEERFSFTGKIMTFDPATGVVVITNTRTDETKTFKLEDTAAVESLKEGKIKIGNKAKIKYIKRDGKDVAVSFKKTERC